MGKNLPKLLQATLVVVAMLGVLLISRELVLNRSFADDSDTSVDVGSTAPSFTVAPAESPASDGTSPTNVGVTITFQATAQDANADDYYLAICKTNAITAGSSSAPTCTGGDWCISTATGTGNQASCEYTVNGADAESNVWYAFVCDGGTCSSSNQGSGSTGSPFKVNHRPTLTSYRTCADTFCSTPTTDFEPGDTVYFEATDAGDADSDTTSDSTQMFICETDSATSSGCTGTTICSSLMGESTCSYNIPSVNITESRGYFIFLFDNHGFESDYNGTELNREGSFEIVNVASIVSSVVVNLGQNIILTESANTNVVMTATVSDANSCTDFNINDIKANLYRSGVTYASCDTAGESNSNNCYADVTCSVSANTCSGVADDSITVTCTASVKHYADPTTTGSQYPTENWIATIDVVDSGLNNASGNSTPVETNTLIALNATSAINYGSLAAGANTGSTNQSVTVTATGNVGLDTELSGSDMTFSTYTIPVGNQEYSTSTFTYGAGTDLSSSPTEVELNVQKTTTDTPASKVLYWGIGLPAIVGAGTYEGVNTITAVLGETANW